MSESILDVLVVGAGPVGLFCANELTRHGLNCRIIDKKQGLSEKSKALGIHIRTLDVLEDCGFIDEIIAQGLKVDGILFKSKEKELINATFAKVEANRHFLIDLPQNKTEEILNKGLIAKDLNVNWQTELTEIEQTTRTVIATLKQADGSSEKVQASWVIACDGSHSTLRKCLYAEFVGSSYKQTWWLADLLIDWNLPENKMVIYISDKGPLACFPMGKKRYRLVMTAPETIEHKEPSMDDIEKAFKQRCSDKATLSDPIWLSQFGIDHKQIQKYRYNRVFFAGDAAHVHSPMGGQGLNTGIQDIYNLAWKLALVHKGFADESLLDSYHSERYPIARNVLKKTGVMTQMVMLTNPLLIGLRNAFMKMITSFDVSKNFILKDIAELSICYAKSPIVKVLGTKTGFKIGEFLIDFPLIDTKSKEKKQLHQITQGTMHHLFFFAGTDTNQLSALIETIAAVDQQFNGLLKTHLVLSNAKCKAPHTNSVWLDPNQGAHKRYAIQQPTAVLIRPDKYIGLTQTPVNQEELLCYMEKGYINKS